MKKRLKFCAAVLSVLLLSASLVGCANGANGGKDDGIKDIAKTFTVKSPDGTVKAETVLNKSGSLFYRVFKENVAIVEYSALGFTLDEEDLSTGLTFEKKEEKEISLSYTNISGKSHNVECKANETVLTLRGTQFYLDVTIRVYDDGYAFRYGIRDVNGDSGTATVSEENSQFAIPLNSRMWLQEYRGNPSGTNCFSYEDPYVRIKSESVTGKTISMPVLYKAGTSDYWSLVTESELIGSGYYGSFLKEVETEQGSGKLQTVPSPAGVQNPNNIIEYPFTSPWRLGITGTLDTVVESELVEKLYDDAEYWKPDDYETLSETEKATYDYDWVETGAGAWSWLQYYNTRKNNPNYAQSSLTLQREYVNFAKEMGWKYCILDGGWKDGLNKTNFKKFTQDAHEKGIKIMVWANGLEDLGHDVATLRSTLKNWKDLGIDGIKLDFLDGSQSTNPTHQSEDIDTIKWYETIYQETATVQMVVNCHGSNKPTGERRKYPHVISREGIMGDESYKTSGLSNVNAMFTRAVVGPSDFTPLVQTGVLIDGWPNNSDTTMGQQMALAVLYESGVVSMADSIAQYRDVQICDFYKNLPVARDETKFIGGEPEDYYCAAIRFGDDWYVAGINAFGARNINFDYAFLDDGNYTAEIFTDGNDRHSVKNESKTVTKSSNETINMASNGGFVVKLTKN